MMLLRVHALYPRSPWITKALAFLLLVETGINVWLISRGEPVLHNGASGVHACSMVFDPAISGAASASAWYPLMYDSIVFALTLRRTLPAVRQKTAGYILKRLLEDGVLYYSVIFCITFVLTLMIISAPPGTKNICAQLEQLITVAMMSRITLSLKKAGRQGEIGPGPLIFDPRDPEFFYNDTWTQSIVIAPPAENLSPVAPHTIGGIKQPQRPILHGPNAIKFYVPPSPHSSQTSDALEFPSPTYPPPPSSLRKAFTSSKNV
ncbi:hypothetical protein FB45DRAFT_897774 [Roridomyces roridus]|uniref:Uncharacterized protein n=1 Tax=Roridomyces roridus TaxID=1738132 RepID=A0AAD7CBG8_9AGAR|nr:hypothetical protein FB45DRAFT_897774 [Roridomyces roridus]